MCGPSIVAKRQRDARVGDVLHPKSFGPHAGIGFVEDGGDAETAICCKTGTKLRLEKIPMTMVNKLGIGTIANALFVEGKDADPDGYHTDTLEFKNGTSVRMQHLGNNCMYMRATVTALPVESHDEQEVREPATVDA